MGRKIIGFILACSAATACERPLAVTAPAKPDHPYFEPAPYVPPPAPVRMTASPHPRLYLGTKSYYAQTFSVNADGYLTALQLALRKIGETETDADEFIVEILRTSALDVIPETGAPVLGRVAIPAAGISAALTPVDAPRFVTIDLAPFRIPAHKNDIFVFRTSYAGEGIFGLEGVGNHSEAGQAFEFAPGYGKKWTPLASSSGNDLVFRAYVAADVPPATAAATQSIRTVAGTAPPAGAVAAEALWVVEKRLPPATRPVGQVRAVPPLLDAVAFTSGGHAYVQVTAFNASNNFVRMSLTPNTITVTPKAGGHGTTIDPLPPNRNFSALSNALGPNEGTIRTYVLDPALRGMPAGDYRVTIVFPRDLSNHAIDAELTLTAATTLPAAAESAAP